MKFEKLHLDDIERCYCASSMTIGGQLYALFASENPDSVCYAYSGEHFEKRETVWEHRGGCMSIVPLESREGEFLAVNEFYLKVTPSLAKIVHGRKTEAGWEIQDVFSLPYLHRFDVYHVGDRDYLICATIARNKKNKEDWSEPGQIYAGLFDPDHPQDVRLQLLADGCFRNHGYCRGQFQGQVCGYFSSDQGVLRVLPPSTPEGQWTIEKILDVPVGEIAFADLDGDGLEEMMTIEPFHGNQMKIYKLKDGRYECDFIYPTEIDFAHTLTAAEIGGVPSFVGGVRRMSAELFVIQFQHGQVVVTHIEDGAGPANVTVVHREDGDYILSANHTKNEAAIYKAAG